MRRRALLTSGVALLPLAGCPSAVPGGGAGAAGSNAAAEPPTARLSMDAIEDAEIPSRLLYDVTSEGSDERTPGSERLDRLERDGSATVDRTRPPLPDDQPLVYGDTVYRLASEVTAGTPAIRFSVTVDVVTRDEREGRTVRFSKLPAVDREVFERNGLASGEVLGIGTTLLYTEAEVERSALVPETTLNTYRYTVEGTTPASEYGREARERSAWGLSGVSDPEREIPDAGTRTPT
jgi:hypothetical protein